MRFWAVVPCALFFLVGASAQDVSSLLSKSMFEQLLKHRNDAVCLAKGFYTYEAFIEAAKFFKDFGTTSNTDTRKREIAAFLAQTSHETTGGSPTAPDGPYAWGYCFKEERDNPDRYRGRGPLQLTGESNYDQAGKANHADLKNDPDLVARKPVISFKAALWFWMTPQYTKPSSHDVMIGNWRPSAADSAAGRVPGYGVVTNIINGGVECGKGPNSKMQDRIGYYRQYCNFLGVSTGINLDCDNQKPFG